MEPFRLREWKVPVGRLFTCGRPGRSKWKDASKVPNDALRKWTQNLPDGKLAIVSLLGRKPDGTSEYSFYPFYGGFDDNDGRPTFRAWLQTYCPGREIVVRDHPTVDFELIPNDTLQNISTDVCHFLEQEYTVILMDSGGVTRTGKVCTFLRLHEKFG